MALVLLLGHRGASARAPENTRPAFEAAIAAGADGVELDAMVCGSGEVVVCHDESLERLAGVSWEIPPHALSGASPADVGSRLGFAPARIPLLEEVLRLIPAGLLINVELKCERVEDDGLSVAAARLVKRLGLRVEGALLQLQPPLPDGGSRGGAGAAARPAARSRPQPAAAGHPDRAQTANASIHPADAQVTPARVSAWHARGLQVVVWTVNDPERARDLEAMGVDACITDDSQSCARACGPCAVPEPARPAGPPDLRAPRPAAP